MARLNKHGLEGDAAERQVRAFDLYRKGWTFRQIGAELGVSHSRVHQYIHAELDALAAQRRDLATKYADAELARLDAMLKALAERAESGEGEAIALSLRIQERRAKLLGLDRPAQVEHSGKLTLEELVAGKPEAPR